MDLQIAFSSPAHGILFSSPGYPGLSPMNITTYNSLSPSTFDAGLRQLDEEFTSRPSTRPKSRQSNSSENSLDSAEGINYQALLVATPPLCSVSDPSDLSDQGHLLTFTPEQVPAAIAIFQQMAISNIPDTLEMLLAHELVEIQNGLGFCLIGHCGTQRAHQRGDSFISAKPLSYLVEHKERMHYYHKKCKNWFVLGHVDEIL
jgi:hypothetical protein